MTSVETVTLDTATLRVAFGVVAGCVLALFYAATYRTTRSAYSGWWCISLVLFIASALLFLFNDTGLQVVANPGGNTVAVAGAGGVWAGARSLRGGTLPRWQFLLGPVVVLVVSVLDDPAHDIWTGGAVFLASMATLIGLSSRELWLLLRSPHGQAESDQYRVSLAAMTGVSALIGVFYLLRAVFFVAVGPDHPAFEIGFGSEVTTLLTMILLVVVTFSMSALSHAQQTTDLRNQATRDSLTGLLNREEFRRRAEEHTRRSRRTTDQRGVVVMVDLDGFKALNDGYGHAAGDRALEQFGAVCRETLRPGDLAGRLGGDEFALLLEDGAGAEQVAAEISRRFRSQEHDFPLPSISFGIAAIRQREPIDAAIAHADTALYRAKAAGRDRTARFDEREATAARQKQRNVGHDGAATSEHDRRSDRAQHSA